MVLIMATAEAGARLMMMNKKVMMVMTVTMMATSKTMMLMWTEMMLLPLLISRIIPIYKMTLVLFVILLILLTLDHPTTTVPSILLPMVMKLTINTMLRPMSAMK